MCHEVSMKPNAMKFLCYMKIYNCEVSIFVMKFPANLEIPGAFPPKILHHH